MTESTKKEVLSFDVTDPSGKMRKQYYIPLIIDIGEKKEIVNVLVRFSTHAVDFSIPTDIYDVDKTRLEAITKGLFRFMKVEEQDNLENLIAFGVRGSPVHKHEILTALAQQRISSKLQTASSSEPAFPLPPAAGSNIRLPPLPDAAEPLLSPESPDERPIDKTRKFGNEANIWLYKSTNESAEPTCRSILEKLSQEEGPLLKMHLTVYVSSDEKDGLGSDEKYEKLLFFIEEKLNANNCPPEEYAAGHKLLEAIKVHATAKDKQKVVKWVEQTVFKVDNLLAEYDRFKLSHPNLNFKGTKGLLRFLLSSNGIKSRNRKLDKVRMEQVRDICAGMLSIEGMTVDAVLDMAIKLVSETNEPEKKQQVLADTKFMLLQWKKLDLSDTAKNRIGINNYKSNDKYIKLKFEVDRNANDPMLPPAPSPFDGFEVPPPPPLEDGNEPPPPPSEGIYSNLPTKTMLQVFLEIDTAINHEAILNSPHILGLSKQLFNDFAEVYSKIKQDEFYGEEGGPNLNKFDDFFTQLTDSVEMNVLNAKNEEAIKNRALFYLKLAETCFDAGNLQAAQAILVVFDSKKLETIFSPILKGYHNKSKIEKIQAILLSNTTTVTEADDKGDIAHKYVEIRKYLRKQKDVPVMPSFSLERADLGNAADSDCLQRSLNLGKILRPVSKRVALVSAKEKTPTQLLYTSANNRQLLEFEPSKNETVITLYSERRSLPPPTCQSIVASLEADGMLPFKGLLIVYKSIQEGYGFGQDERYTILLKFIEQKLKAKDCSAEEYDAGHKLLEAIKLHAKNNNKQKIIKKVDAIVGKRLNQAKTNLSSFLKYLNSGALITVEGINENKIFIELKKSMNKCTPGEKAALLSLISAQKKGKLIQSISLLEVLLKQSTYLAPSKQKVIDILKSLDKNSGVDVVKKINENKNYKELKKLIKKCNFEEQKMLMNFIAGQKTTKPQLAQHIGIFEALLKKEANMKPASPVILTKASYISPVVQARSVPLPSVAPPPLAVPETPSGPRTLPVNPPPLLFSAVHDRPPEKILDIELAFPSLRVAKAFKKGMDSVTFTPQISSNKTLVTYNAPPGMQANQLSALEEPFSYKNLVKHIFEVIDKVMKDNPEAKPFTLIIPPVIPPGLAPNKASALKEVIQKARKENPNIHIELKDGNGDMIDQNGNVIYKPSNSAKPRA